MYIQKIFESKQFLTKLDLMIFNCYTKKFLLNFI